MRAVIAVALLLSGFAFGCDDDSGNKVVADLSMLVSPKPDMTVVAETCLGIISCAAGCSDVGTCLNACAAAGSTTAQAKYTALENCAIAGCVPVDLGAAAACTNPPGPSPAPACQTCISGYAQSSACSTELTACLDDK